MSRSRTAAEALATAVRSTIEPLESRTLLSVTIKPVTGASGMPGLQITGNKSADNVLIVDNQVDGTIDVTANGKTTQYTGIESFSVDLEGGNDKLEYNLVTAGPAEARAVRLDGDSGDDRIVFTSLYEEPDDGAALVGAVGDPVDFNVV